MRWETAAAPSSHAGGRGALTAEDVKKWLNDAEQLETADSTVRKGIITLERLFDGADAGGKHSDRDSPVTELPQSVQSGDVDTLSVEGSGGHQTDRL